MTKPAIPGSRAAILGRATPPRLWPRTNTRPPSTLRLRRRSRTASTASATVSSCRVKVSRFAASGRAVLRCARRRNEEQPGNALRVVEDDLGLEDGLLERAGHEDHLVLRLLRGAHTGLLVKGARLGVQALPYLGELVGRKGGRHRGVEALHRGREVTRGESIDELRRDRLQITGGGLLLPGPRRSCRQQEPQQQTRRTSHDSLLAAGVWSTSATLQRLDEALGGVGREHVGKRGADEHVAVATRRVHAIAAERLIAEASVVAEKAARPERTPGARQAIGGQPLDALDRAQRNLDGTDEAIDRQASIRDRVSARGQKEAENERGERHDAAKQNHGPPGAGRRLRQGHPGGQDCPGQKKSRGGDGDERQFLIPGGREQGRVRHGGPPDGRRVAVHSTRICVCGITSRSIQSPATQTCSSRSGVRCRLSAGGANSRPPSRTLSVPERVTGRSSQAANEMNTAVAGGGRPTARAATAGDAEQLSGRSTGGRAGACPPGRTCSPDRYRVKALSRPISTSRDMRRELTQASTVHHSGRRSTVNPAITVCRRLNLLTVISVSERSRSGPEGPISARTVSEPIGRFRKNGTNRPAPQARTIVSMPGARIALTLAAPRSPRRVPSTGAASARAPDGATDRPEEPRPCGMPPATRPRRRFARRSPPGRCRPPDR